MSFARLVLLAAIAGSTLILARADAEGDAKAVVEDSAVRQAQLKRSFENLRAKMAVLAGRLESSSINSDREKAKAIRAAMKEASSRGTEAKFDSLIRALGNQNADKDIDVLALVLKDNKELRDDLKKILDLLSSDGRDKQLADQKDKALRLIAELKELRDKQARAQTQTELGKKETKDLAKDQAKITDQTKNLIDELDKPSADRTPEEEKDAKAVRKPVGDANASQMMAQSKLGKGDKDGAGESQGKAVKKLDEAISNLQNQVEQIRQEERERKLTDLLARAKRMLRLEEEIRDGTEALFRDLGKSQQKPGVEQAAHSNRLADKQLANLRECGGALELLRADGTAAAFTEVFEQLEKDMDTAQRRLNRVEVDTLTLAITTDLVDTLKEIVRSLEKAIKDNQPNNNNPSPPSPPGPDRDEPLVNLLQQLKMVYAMQKRVNDRTALYAKHYKGEQLPTSADQLEKERYTRVAEEMKELAGRQDRIAKVTKEIGKEPNGRRID